MGEARSTLRIDAAPQRDVPILVMDGVLDGSTYRTVRDTVIKAALDEPRAVVVDVNGLSMPSASAWTVFTSARWHVSVWPDVPILLVCGEPAVRRAIASGGMTRYVPVYPTRLLALDAVDGRPLPVRRRARTELPAAGVSIGVARALVTNWLTQWRKHELVPVAATVATALVENVLDHTQSAPVLIVERYRESITIAVEDCSGRLPGRHEDADRGPEVVSGLAMVSALCRAWGAIPTSSGKTVWALVGHENLL
ncbi:sulfate transporter [Mycobacterium alsense]|uniref:STAS domain-containing protein n=1 Tax=Mycobacterium alsense TaxID=324058 RepID=UPI0007FFB19B|nr:STAS domain-containing protein [Mycobacterium alsense]OBJ05544.1 sulfate transporter [Mycobacterium alsense]